MNNAKRISAARKALAAHRIAKDGPRAPADEADARDLIADVLLMMRKDGKDVARELRMAFGNFAGDKLPDDIALTATKTSASYAAAARAAGWVWDEGGPHWFKPSARPLHDKGQYAKTAREACDQDGIAPTTKRRGK